MKQEYVILEREDEQQTIQSALVLPKTILRQLALFEGDIKEVMDFISQHNLTNTDIFVLPVVD